MMAEEQETSQLDKLKNVIKEVVVGVLDERDKKTDTKKPTKTETTDDTTVDGGSAPASFLDLLFGTSKK